MSNNTHKHKKPSKKAVTQPKPQTWTSNGPDPEKEQAIQAIRTRCLELIGDARGLVPGLRIVGVFGLHDALAEQTATSLLCYDTLAIASQRLSDDTEKRVNCACDGDEFLCEDCRADMERILKQQGEELADGKKEEQS